MPKPAEMYIVHIAENGYVIRPHGVDYDPSVPMQIAADGTLEENLKALRVSRKVSDQITPPAQASNPKDSASAMGLLKHHQVLINRDMGGLLSGYQAEPELKPWWKV